MPATPPTGLSAEVAALIRGLEDRLAIVEEDGRCTEDELDALAERVRGLEVPPAD